MANFYGELVIRITSDTKGLTAGLNQSAAATAAASKKMEGVTQTAAQRINRVGMGLQNFGRTMTQFVTLPVAAGFAVAGIAAFKFQDTMLKVKNLTGLTAQQTQMYSEQLLEMGKVTGQTPIKMAEAFYFLASSGFEGQQAMDALNAAAKASSAGLGDVMKTADVVSSAVNAYGKENLSAAHMVDVLMRTIEVGKAEPEQLAASLGRIMPVAQGLAIPIEDLGGMIAGLTLTGLSSAEAVTALRGAMMALTAPTKMSIEAYKEMGLTYKQVTDRIAKKGLLETLQFLYEKVDGDRLAMRKLIPNVRALNGVLGLLGPNYKKNLEVIEQVNHAQGKLNETFKATQQTPVQKLRVAWAGLQAEFIKIGAIVLPIIADFAGYIAGLLSSFNSLSPSVRGFILAVVALSAVVGPATMMLGSFLRALALIGPALAGGAGVGASLAAIGSALAVAVPAAAIAAAIATAVTVAIDAGMKKAAENATANAKSGGKWGWEEFVSESKAMFTAPGKWFSEWSGNNEIDAVNDVFWNAKKALDAFSQTSAMAGQKARYLREDLAALRADRSILGDLRVDKTVQQMQEWRRAVMDNLKVSKREAEAVLRTMFGPDIAFSQKQWKAMNSGIEGAQKKVRDLKAELARATAFGDIPLITSLNKQLAAAEARVTRIQTAATRQQLARAANSSQVPGLKDWVGGGGGLRIPVPQWQGKMKFPKVDVGGAKVALQGMGKYLDAVTKTRKLTIKAKISTVQDAIKGMQARLKEIGDKPTSAKLKAEKSALETAVSASKKLLRSLRDQQTRPKIDANPQPALSAIQQVKDAMAGLQDKVVTITVNKTGPPIPKNAWGGYYKSPLLTVVGDNGPKGELVLPLDKPKRVAELMRAAGMGAGMASTPDLSKRGGYARAAVAGGDGGGGEVHYHSHVTIPNGVVVDGKKRLAEELAPWSYQQQRVAQRRKARGRARRA